MVQGISIKTKYTDSELHSNLYLPKLIIIHIFEVIVYQIKAKIEERKKGIS